MYVCVQKKKIDIFNQKEKEITSFKTQKLTKKQNEIQPNKEKINNEKY